MRFLSPEHGWWTFKASGASDRPSRGCGKHRGAMEGTAASQAVDSSFSGTGTSQVSVVRADHVLLWGGGVLITRCPSLGGEPQVKG